MQTPAPVLVIAVFFSLAGCTRPSEPLPRLDPSAEAPPPTPVASGAPSVAPSVAPSEPTVASPEVAGSASASSDGAWPKGTRTLTLLWEIHPAVDHLGTITRHIGLVARAGSVTRTQGIDAHNSISFAMDMQPLCQREGMKYDSAKTVAQLNMNGGGNLWYTVERASPELLEIWENTSSDGLCTDAAGHDEPCPVTRTRRATMDVPPEARIIERFVEISRDGAAGQDGGRVRAHPLDCPH